jgi:hypothetical protein
MATVLLLAFLLGLFVWGIGHLYIGSTTRGVVFLSAGVILFILGFIVSVLTAGLGLILFIFIDFVVYLIQGFDAHIQAKKLGIT